jgi:hypothetical protein
MGVDMDFQKNINRILDKFSDDLRGIGCDECCIIMAKPDGNMFIAQTGKNKAIRNHSAETLYAMFRMHGQSSFEVDRDGLSCLGEEKEKQKWDSSRE